MRRYSSINISLDWPVIMDFKLVNLTALFVLQEIEDILSTYPKAPDQIAFSIPDLRQQLIVHVLHHFPHRYTVVETRHDISRASNLWQFCVEECLAIESKFSITIINLLQDEQCSVQDMPIDTFSLNSKTDSQLLSSHYNNAESSLIQTQQLEQRYREISIPGLTHLNLKASLRGAAEAILNNRDSITTLRFVRYDRSQLRKSCILNDIKDFLQICNSTIAIYQGLTIFSSCLFFNTKGGFFWINSLNDCIESISTWEVSLNDEPFFITPYFGRPCKRVEVAASRCDCPAILGSIKVNSWQRFVIIFLAKSLRLLIYLTSTILWELSNYLKCKIREKVFYNKK